MKNEQTEFRVLVGLLNKAESALLEASYLIYKDQNKAERICEKRGWSVKYLKQLRRATYQAYRRGKAEKGGE